MKSRKKSSVTIELKLSIRSKIWTTNFTWWKSN